MVEDVEYLLTVKFRLILFSCCSEEVENVTAKQRPGRPSWFSDQSEKHKRQKLEDVEILPPFLKVSLNYV